MCFSVDQMGRITVSSPLQNMDCTAICKAMPHNSCLENAPASGENSTESCSQLCVCSACRTKRMMKGEQNTVTSGTRDRLCEQAKVTKFGMKGEELVVPCQRIVRKICGTKLTIFTAGQNNLQCHRWITFESLASPFHGKSMFNSLLGSA